MGLAALTYDSALEAMAGAARGDALRSRHAAVADLRLASLTIELEVGRDALLGQVQPAQAAQAEVITRNGAVTRVDVDAVGWFTVRPVPRSPFRIACTTHHGSIKS